MDLDRVEAGVERTRSLTDRLRGRPRSQYPPRLLRRIAQSCYLLTEAIRSLEEGIGSDLFISVETQSERGKDPADLKAFAGDIAQMYRNWGKRRRMRMAVLHGGVGQPGYLFYAVYAVTGYGALRILQKESGYHVLEKPQGKRNTDRFRIRVRVVPQPIRPARDHPELVSQSEEAFRAAGRDSPVVVRRYRFLPDPLVRDGVRGWRSGNLQGVLEGNFDLIG